MISQSEEKITGGKLLRIKLELDPDKNKIIKIQITGDFFIHPEEKLKFIEDELKNISTKISEEQLNDITNEVISQNDIQLIGIDSRAIARNMRNAIIKVYKTKPDQEKNV